LTCALLPFTKPPKMWRPVFRATLGAARAPPGWLTLSVPAARVPVSVHELSRDTRRNLLIRQSRTLLHPPTGCTGHHRPPQPEPAAQRRDLAAELRLNRAELVGLAVNAARA
jgi:hypothetical protein